MYASKTPATEFILLKTLSYDDESGFGRFIRKSVLNFLRYGGGCRFYYLFIT